MRRALWPAALALALNVATTSAAEAQLWEAGLPGDDVASVNLDFGAILPTTTLPDGSSHENGMMIGASATWWPLKNVGFRGHVRRGETAGVHGEEFSAAAFYAGSVWLYGADLVLRYPIMDDRVSPYISGGPGGKSYRWSHSRPRRGETAFAWTAAGGVDLRPAATGPFGVSIELRYYRSEYYWHGLGYQDPRPSFEWHGPTVNDLGLTAGMTLNW